MHQKFQQKNKTENISRILNAMAILLLYLTINSEMYSYSISILITVFFIVLFIFPIKGLKQKHPGFLPYIILILKKIYNLILKKLNYKNYLLISNSFKSS